MLRAAGGGGQDEAVEGAEGTAIVFPVFHIYIPVFPFPCSVTNPDIFIGLQN